MNVYLKLLVSAGMALLCRCLSAQTDTIYLSAAQAEDLFIRKNLQLIAEKLEIDMADAAIVQAKLWPNPTLTVEDINLWITSDMRDEMKDIFSSGTFALNRQFSIGLEQLIITGGKRRKLIDMERVSRDMAIQYFEELLRGLKIELRNACAEALYLQEYRKVLENHHSKLEMLVGNYRNQVAQGNVSRSEQMRLEASLFEALSEINELQRDMNEQQKELKTLLNISTPSHIILTATEIKTKSPEELSYGRLIELADASRPDLKEAMFQKDFSEKTLRYEKAQRTPDITLNATYDRAGGVTPKYFGFGASIDLPIFDRNKGNIRAAQTAIRQSQLFAEQKQLEVRNEVIHALQNYMLAYDFNRQIGSEFITNLDEMQESYTRNFINKNIGIVEFLDFFEAWKGNKRTVLDAQKAVKTSFEELQFAVGTEF